MSSENTFNSFNESKVNKEEEKVCNCNSNNNEEEKIPSKAKIAKPCYKRFILEPNQTYYYCTCGFSKDGAMCDDTCKTSGEEIKGWKPKEFTVKHKSGYSICCCKRTDIPPFCDGSHSVKELDW
ncbi:hypothetical protein ABK040_014345 [Willaertia magna]